MFTLASKSDGFIFDRQVREHDLSSRAPQGPRLARSKPEA
jgi:hypothetical protein